MRPHLPFYAPQRYWELYPESQVEIARNRSPPLNVPRALSGTAEIRTYHDRGVEYNSEEFHRVARRGYYACVSYVDALIGRLLGALDDLGIRERTVVVVWGDHGWQLGEHGFWAKNNLLHKSLRSPLIISAPGLMQGEEVSGIVELIDLYPSLCELAGVTVPSHVQGKSFVPLMSDSSLPGRTAAYMRDTQGEAVITEQHLYAEYSSGERLLFDHTSDSGESVNVVAQPDYADTVLRMGEILAQRSSFAEERVDR